jgi:energy-coupling factor transporter ATP-binding protein EcfA2
MIDFSKILSFNLGQRHSFEELVCQLARRESFPEHSVFRRVEGAGGDGGVEAYWTKPNGRKTGYQAKYFLRIGDIGWDQIDESVTQALISHPELECYVVALPCDLTDRSGKKQRGQTGWDNWSARVQKWEAEASAVGIKDIAFQVWPKSALTARLANSNVEGLREFFFGDILLSIQWFGNKIQEVILALDERFHPEDHVDVRIERLFSVISRAPSYREELLKALHAIGKFALPGKRLSALKQNPEEKLCNDLQKTFVELLGIDDQISFDPQHDWDAEGWCNLASKLLVANEKLQQWHWKYESSLSKENHERYNLRQCIQESRELDEAVDLLTKLLRSRYMDAEKEGIAFIRGNAGSGKSHLLAKCADNAIKHEQPAILLLGQRLNDSEIWTQISQILGLTGRSTDQILGALDAAGKSAGVRTLLLIDAINEGAGTRYWRNQISSLVHKLKGFTHVCCIISCRSEYFEQAVPCAIAKQYPVFDIRGFETPEEQLNAARVYLDRRGIARPSTPWLSPEFVNPLFLRSVCLSLERDKRSEFPPGLTGTRQILKYYLESIGRNITEKEGSTISLVPKLGRAVLDIAGKMLERKKDFLELDICSDTIVAHFRNINPKTEPDWLSVFLNNGLLRKDPNPSSGDDFVDEDVVRFSFQRFQDFLMAERALQDVEEVDGLFDDKGPLGFCIKVDQFSWEWRGLMDALAVALPEKLQIELVDALPGGGAKWWDDWSIHKAFAESVKWRARSTFTDRTIELLNDFRNPESLELLLQVAVSADHPWNAELLHKDLERRKLPDRDAFWTMWINAQSDDVDSSVGVLIEWCRIGQAPHTNPENQFLAGLVLCWFFTSSNRAIRDKSTKALANLLLTSEDIFPKLLSRFVDVDDLYILGKRSLKDVLELSVTRW